MTRYDRYLSGRILLVTLQTVIAFLLLFMLVDFLSGQYDRMERYETPAIQGVYFYLSYIPLLLFEYNMLAVSVLVAGLIVIGRAAQSNETVALMAAGVSLRRIALAPLVIALLLSVAALLVHDVWGIRAIQWHTEIKDRYFARAEWSTRSAVSWPQLPGGWSCHVLNFNPDAMTGQDIFLHRNTSDRLDEIRARRMYWDAPSGQWILEDGRWFSTSPGEDWRQQVTRITQAPAPFSASPEELFALEQDPATRTLGELSAALERAHSEGAAKARGWLAWNSKLAKPFLIAVMMLLAIPFAVRVRQGGMVAGFGLGIGIALFCLLVFFGSSGLAYLMILPPVVGAWAANVIFGAAGGVLLLRSPT